MIIVSLGYKRNFGFDKFDKNCYIYMSTSGVLTVKHKGTDAVIKAYAPEQWIEVEDTAFGQHSLPK